MVTETEKYRHLNCADKAVGRQHAQLAVQGAQQQGLHMGKQHKVEDTHR